MPASTGVGPSMASTSPLKTLYRVLFYQQGKMYEVYVRGIFQSELYGFVELEDFVFGERGAANPDIIDIGPAS